MPHNQESVLSFPNTGLFPGAIGLGKSNSSLVPHYLGYLLLEPTFSLLVHIVPRRESALVLHQDPQHLAFLGELFNTDQRKLRLAPPSDLPGLPGAGTGHGQIDGLQTSGLRTWDGQALLPQLSPISFQKQAPEHLKMNTLGTGKPSQSALNREYTRGGGGTHSRNIHQYLQVVHTSPHPHPVIAGLLSMEHTKGRGLEITYNKASLTLRPKPSWN